jgi:hypothetical protein
MATCYPITLLPMDRETYDATGSAIDVSTSVWFVFPEEVERQMAGILQPYGFDSNSEDMPDAEHLLGQIEYMCRDESGRYPWAIIFCAAEYPLAGYLFSIRQNREIRFANYSMFHPRRSEGEDSVAESVPLLSILFIFSKAALMTAAETESPLVREAARLLADKPENGAWVVIADPLDPSWVQKMALESDALYFALR